LVLGKQLLLVDVLPLGDRGVELVIVRTEVPRLLDVLDWHAPDLGEKGAPDSTLPLVQCRFLLSDRVQLRLVFGKPKRLKSPAACFSLNPAYQSGISGKDRLKASIEPGHDAISPVVLFRHGQTRHSFVSSMKSGNLDLNQA